MRLPFCMKIGVLIPAYNAGSHITDVFSGTFRYVPPENVIVIDDGSTDGTRECTESAGIVLLRHRVNRGKGEALKTGFAAASERNFDAVVTLDGDGQHDPDRIPEFIRLMESTGSDIVLGIRPFRLGEMPLDRICSNRLSSMITSFVAGKRIRDSQVGYRMIRRQVFESIHTRTHRFEAETEFLVRAVWAGFRISYCPVQAMYAGEGSHIRRWKDTLRFCRLMTHLIWERM